MDMPQPPAPKRSLTVQEDIAPSIIGNGEISYFLAKHLTTKQRSDPNILLWIKEYISTRDVGQAAARIGLGKAEGAALRRDKNIAMCIQAITENEVFKHGIDPSEIVQKVKEISEADPIECQNADGTWKTHLKDIPPETRRAIKKLVVKNLFGEDPNGMKTVIGEIVTIVFYDKQNSQELLGREGGLFKETKKVEHALSENMSAILLESKQRGETIAAEYVDVTEVGDE